MNVLLRKLRQLHYAFNECLDNWFDRCRQEYYGQVGEDAVLRHYLRKEVGFYVDIGAFQPRRLSNTYYFYKKGWHGINVDATPGSMQRFRRVRPRDVNIECGVSDQEGSIVLYVRHNGGMNTMSPDTAEHFTRILGTAPSQIRVQTRPLRDILAANLPAGQVIDLMSIDVEGVEMAVLRSNDWGKYRPGVIVIEILGKTIEELIASAANEFLRANGYQLRGFLPPNAFYEETNYHVF